MQAAKRQITKYGYEIFTALAAGKGWPSLFALFRRRRSISEIVCSGMPSRELNACAAMNRKKIIGCQQISDAAVRALLTPACRSVTGFGSEKSPRKFAGPWLLVKA